MNHDLELILRLNEIHFQAITGEKILSRSEKIRDALESYLSQIQTIVPLLLAAKISGIIRDIGNAKFQLDHTDKEAAKVLLSLIRMDVKVTSESNEKELEALQIAASKLNITSPVAALTERRRVKRLLGKVNESTSPRNVKLLRYLYYLLKKYGTQMLRPEIKCEYDEKEEEEPRMSVNRDQPEPPEEFKCPISKRLMYDPSIIASGQTFERVWIERWFSEGNETCPVTGANLDHRCVTLNSSMKSLIEKWCSKHGILVPNPRLDSSLTRSKSSSSIASFNSGFDDLQLQVGSVSIYSSTNSCGSGFSSIGGDDDDDNKENYEASEECSNALGFLSSLADLSWESQNRVVTDVKKKLLASDKPRLVWVTSHDFVSPLIKFMNDAAQIRDPDALSDGADLLLAILNHNRNEIPQLEGEAIYLLTSFLGSEITGKALAILEVLSYERCFVSATAAAPGVLPAILALLQEPSAPSCHVAMKILCNLSINGDIGAHMVYLGYVPALARLMRHVSLGRHVVEALKNLCGVEDGWVAVSESAECVAGIGEILAGASGGDEEEHALDALLALCHHGGDECRRRVVTEKVIESLVYLSVNGNSRVKLMAMELLQLDGGGGDIVNNGSKPSIRNAALEIDRPCNSRSNKKSYSKAFWSLSRDVSRFAKSR